MLIPISQFIPPPFSPSCGYTHLLGLGLYFCFAHRFICPHISRVLICALIYNIWFSLYKLTSLCMIVSGFNLISANGTT